MKHTTLFHSLRKLDPKRRKRRGMTITELARRTGLSRQTVYDVVAGRWSGTRGGGSVVGSRAHRLIERALR